MGGADLVAAGGTELPQEFGKYTILGHLATGGMAEVYIARQGGLQGFEKIVVIKRVRPELNDDSTVMSHFLDEARLVATLEHPNIAQVYEIGMVNGSYFFVMEYVHGADLRQLMVTALRKKQQVSLADAIYIVSHVCAALHYAHEKKSLDGTRLDIIHRDVSPSNVLLSHDGAVKVCDFGIAKAQNQSHETQRGTLKGKYSYMSPEQCRCEPLDRRSDVFALGVILYELTTLSRLFKAENDFELLRMIVDKPVPPPSSRVLEYPKDLERIVMKALAKDAGDRYPTAQAMQLDLEAFAREHKLAMSSVNIATLMGQLFEKKVEAWMNAQRAHKSLGDHLMDTAIRNSGEMPVFVAVGSNQDEPDADVDTQPAPARKSTPSMATPTSQITRRGPSALWLIAVVVAALAGAGVTVAARSMATTDDHAAKQALEGDVDKLASAIDATVRSARMRADSMAATPMLRAAIETDAATMKDLAEHEYVFSVGKNETVEIFQLRGATATSLLRLPAGAPALTAPKPQETRLQGDRNVLVAVVASPIAGSKASVAGNLALAVPIDLASARRTLAEHATRASIIGAGSELALIAGKAEGGTPITIPIATSGDLGAQLSLVAVPIAAAAPTLTWAAPVRYGAFGLAAVFLLVYVAGLRRGSR